MSLAIYTPPSLLTPFGKVNPDSLEWKQCHKCHGTGEIMMNSQYSLDPQEAYSVPCEYCEGCGEIPSEQHVDSEWEVAA